MTGEGVRGVWRLLWVWGPVLGLMAAIFVVSDQPAPPELPGRIPDVVAHALVYAVLGALMLRATAGARWLRVTLGNMALAVVLTAAYGLTDEFHQSFVPGRTAEARDLAADAVGGAAGAGLVWGWGIVLAVRRGRHDRRQPEC